MKKFFTGILTYLKDWRNWLSHGLMGIALLILAIWVPVALWIKLIFIGCLICFNILRMRHAAMRKKRVPSNENNTEVALKQQ